MIYMVLKHLQALENISDSAFWDVFERKLILSTSLPFFSSFFFWKKNEENTVKLDVM